jgi:hypothetical protein
MAAPAVNSAAAATATIIDPFVMAVPIGCALATEPAAVAKICCRPDG